MADDNRIFVKDAADFIGGDAPQIISRAWKLGTVRLYGVRPGETEPVEISPHECGSIDYEDSCVVIGDLCTTYRSVRLKVADLEWLAQAQDKCERQARQASEAASSSLQAAANARNLSPAEIGRAGGKKSGESRRASRKWVPHATMLAQAVCSREPAASNEDIAVAIADEWKLHDVDYPGPKTLSRFVSEQRASRQLPKKSGKRRT
jgi:hypothetical protein